MVKNKTIEEKYQKLTQREHVLQRPGMYIGSVKKQLEELWCLKEHKMQKTMVEFSPGFMKIFDEVLTNALDHSTRDSTLNTIKVDFNKETGEITVWNNGSGIPVIEHKEHKMYVPELIFGHLLSGSNYDDSEARTGAGTNGLGSKCYLHSTPTPLFNGEIKKASDIKIGDILIGDDGTPRKVLNKTEGFGEMYKIIQHYGEDYVVNNNHTLTLHMPDHKVIFWNTNGWSSIWWNNDKKCIETKFIKVFSNTIKCPECHIDLNSRLIRHYKRQHKDKEIPLSQRKSPTYGDMTIQIIKEKYNEMQKFLDTIPFESVFDINIQDYLKLNKTTQRRMAGLRCDYVKWEEKQVDLDPYILGLWLGDGMKTGRSFACYGEKDPEIIDYIKEWCDKNDAIFVKKDYVKYTYTFHSKSNFGKKNSSPLRNLLKKYNLIDNKHIPRDYLINSREIRLKVLAGLIDTDGTAIRDGTRIILTQSHVHKQLVDNIVYLVRSLGFFCTVKSFIAKYVLGNGDKMQSEAYRINISGNIEEIPTLLPRKKCNNTKKHNTDKSTGYIRIEKVNEAKYIGLTVDKNQRFVINDFTVTHNCTNIYSKKFIVETVDNENSKKFIQEYSDNMSQKNPPKITKSSVKSYTKISFIPDYQRFDMSGLEDDIISLISKRCYDLIACTNNNVSIYLNGEKLKGKGLTDYIKFFVDESKIIHETFVKDQFIWEYAVVPSEHYEQISFVNGNETRNGGKHVDYILYQIINKIKTMLETKKKLKDVKPNFIKDKIFLFLRATVVNPSFNSQTKEQLTTPSKDFGVSVTVSDKFIDKIYKSSIVEDIVEFCKLKETSDLSKKTDGSKKIKLYGIPKLEDALLAGTSKSEQCTLILTEGLSAMTFALWGRSVLGPDKIGCYPLKGKILNIRDATTSQLLNNEELNNIKQIIGLKQNVDYKDTKSLRYGKVMILTDADVDGSHIRGLFINFIHATYPSLIKLNFIQTMKTPIVKAIKGKQVLEFFNEQDYNIWKQNTQNIKSYNIKYFKGLGTSKKEDAQDLFKRLGTLRVDYYYKDTKCDESILLAFEKDKNIKEQEVSCTDQRKKWLSHYDKNSYIDLKETKTSYQDLINKDLIHFSIYDNLRSIPSLCDGLKPSQRKILYYMLKNNISTDIKVAQLSGYISAEMSYHHGEASLQGAIINMAQDFVGSNNINLLTPEGNFGSRLNTGKDAASSRYIFTKLNNITTQVFNSLDNPLYTYLNDDGTTIEPEYLMPIIPMILVNGCEGIGTGYSTYIPQYNPKDIIQNLLYLLHDKSYTQPSLYPYFKNFNGDVVSINDTQFMTVGKWKKISNTKIEITELPVGTGIIPYKEFLETFIEHSKNTIKKKFYLKDVENKTKDENTEISFIIEFKHEKDLTMLIDSNTITKELKLTKSFTTNNMYLFNPNLILTKYSSPFDILQEFYNIRLTFYEKRRVYMIQKIKDELIILKSKIRFIDEYINNILDINKKSKSYMIELLEQRKYHKLNNTYEYLINMPIVSFTSEKISELTSQHNKKENELNHYQINTDKQLWIIDLNLLLSVI